jgi:tRNA-2-methylthio-N6-dimethylallyladenosine synthase
MSKKDPNFMTGKTGSNKTVNFAGGNDLRGMLVSVMIKDIHLHSLKGELV